MELFDDRFNAAKLNSTIQHLAEIAAATEIAILLVVNCPERSRATVTHQIKGLESAVQSAWWIGGDPYRPERRLLLPVKMNLIEKSPGRSFLINNAHVEWDARPIWLTAERFQAETRDRVRLPLYEQEFSELARAIHWLREFLQKDVHEYKIIKTAADFVGIGERTLRRAFCKLKGVSWRIPGTNSWAWRLREGDVVNPQFPRSVDRFIYDENETGEDEADQSEEQPRVPKKSNESEPPATDAFEN